MEKFYLAYDKTDATDIFVSTNLIAGMLQNRKEYEKEEYLIALSIVLEKVNESDNVGRARFKELCEENGMIFYNAFRVIKNLGNDLIDNNLREYISFYYDILEEATRRLKRRYNVKVKSYKNS